MSKSGIKWRSRRQSSWEEEYKGGKKGRKASTEHREQREDPSLAHLGEGGRGV